MLSLPTICFPASAEIKRQLKSIIEHWTVLSAKAVSSLCFPPATCRTHGFACFCCHLWSPRFIEANKPWPLVNDLPGIYPSVCLNLQSRFSDFQIFAFPSRPTERVILPYGLKATNFTRTIAMSRHHEQQPDWMHVPNPNRSIISCRCRCQKINPGGRTCAF